MRYTKCDRDRSICPCRYDESTSAGDVQAPGGERGALPEGGLRDVDPSRCGRERLAVTTPREVCASSLAIDADDGVERRASASDVSVRSCSFRTPMATAFLARARARRGWVRGSASARRREAWDAPSALGLLSHHGDDLLRVRAHGGGALRGDEVAAGGFETRGRWRPMVASRKAPLPACILVRCSRSVVRFPPFRHRLPPSVPSARVCVHR